MPGVYYPREDSELVADYIAQQDLAGKRILDVGTGCGVLAILAAHAGATVEAIDISEKACINAQRNAALNNVAMQCYQSNLFEQVTNTFDMILCNPPYIPGETELDTTEETSWHAGHKAEMLKQFLTTAPSYCKPAGNIYCVWSTVTGISPTPYGSICARKKVPWETLMLVHIST